MRNFDCYPLISRILQSTKWEFAIVLTLCSFALAQGQAGPLRFQVRLSPDLRTGVQSGRLIVFLSSEKEPQQELRRELGEISHSTWMAAGEIHGLGSGETFNFDPDRLAWPTSLSEAPTGDYQAMAVLDVNHHYAYNGLNPGDLRSRVLQIKGLDPRQTKPIPLMLAERVEPTRLNLPTGIERLISLVRYFQVFGEGPFKCAELWFCLPATLAAHDVIPQFICLAGLLLIWPS